jgi:flagella basal body P-ring formation protein FlgA
MSEEVYAETGKVETALRQHIQQEISDYLAQLEIKSQNQEIELSLAPGIEQQSCHQLNISRSQAAEPPLGRISYRIDCNNPSWQGRAVAKVKLWINIVVANKTIQNQEQLTLDMLTLASREISALNRSPIVDSQAILGMTVKRRIQQNDPLTWHVLENPDIIKRGALVTLLIRSAGFSASTKAIALEDAKKGQNTKVENASSGQIVEGIATGPGLVETELKN